MRCDANKKLNEIATQLNSNYEVYSSMSAKNQMEFNKLDKKYSTFFVVVVDFVTLIWATNSISYYLNKLNKNKLFKVPTIKIIF